MAYTVPTTEPSQLRCGDTWQWTRELDDYPASDWTLTYYFRNATAHFDAAATASGDTHVISIAKATTATRAPGWYDWTAFVNDADERYEVDSGRIELLPDLATAKPHDGRTWARRMLDYVEAALESRASSDQLDLIEAALDMRKIKRGEGGLLILRSQLDLEVKRETAVKTGENKSRILVRFP